MKPEVLVLNKIDLLDETRVRTLVEELEGRTGREVIAISALIRINLDTLVSRMFKLVPEKPEIPGKGRARFRAPRPARRPLPAENTLVVRRVSEGEFVVEGEIVEYLLSKYRLEFRDSLKRVVDILERCGVSRKLRDAGARDGDTVYLLHEGGHVFEYME